MARTCSRALMLAKDAMLEQTITIGAAARMIDAWHEDLRITALKLEKDVEREKDAKKLAIISASALAYRAHVESLEAETRPIPLNVPKPDFAVVMKGKRLVSAWQDAVNTVLANAKIEADAVAKDIRAKQAWFFQNDNDPSCVSWMFLFSDLQQIIYKPMNDFKLLVTTRIEAHKKADAEKIERIRVEEETKATAKAKAEQDVILAAERVKMEAEVKAKVEAEQRAHAEYEAGMIAEQEKIAALQKTLDRGEEIEAAAVEERRKQAPVMAKLSSPTVAQVLASAKAEVNSRPTDEAIVDALSILFRVSGFTVIEWLLEMDIEAVGERIAIEFQSEQHEA